METKLLSATKEVIIGHERPTILIGERINPTGRKKMLEALKAGDLEIVKKEAVAQVEAGADVLDVHVGGFGIDEAGLLPEAVKLVMSLVDVPLCIDSTNVKAMEAALKVYKGRALINSVTGEEKSLAGMLPLVKEYNAAVIGLVQDDDGIPNTAEKRIAVAQKIVDRAEKLGISRDSIIIDCLALSVGANPTSGLVVLETIRRVRSELGLNAVLAASNFSFGLPNREVLSNTFAGMAVGAGTTCLICDAAKVKPVILAADLIVNQDKRARRYIQAFRQQMQNQ